MFLTHSSTLNHVTLSAFFPIEVSSSIIRALPHLTSESFPPASTRSRCWLMFVYGQQLDDYGLLTITNEELGSAVRVLSVQWCWLGAQKSLVKMQDWVAAEERMGKRRYQEKNGFDCIRSGFWRDTDMEGWVFGTWGWQMVATCRIKKDKGLRIGVYIKESWHHSFLVYLSSLRSTIFLEWHKLALNLLSGCNVHDQSSRR